MPMVVVKVMPYGPLLNSEHAMIIETLLGKGSMLSIHHRQYVRLVVGSVAT